MVGLSRIAKNKNDRWSRHFKQRFVWILNRTNQWIGRSKNEHLARPGMYSVSPSCRTGQGLRINFDHHHPHDGGVGPRCDRSAGDQQPLGFIWWRNGFAELLASFGISAVN
jgi:hypothetical protein